VRSAWALDPSVVFLNHGAFGATPIAVLEAQRSWRDRLEAEPVRFLDRELEGHLDAARADLAAFVGADPDDLAFVPNATSGVATILRSLRFEPGDEILVTDHEYNAVLNAARHAASCDGASRDGARVVVAEVPFPIAAPDEVTAAVLARVTGRTRLAIVSHVTSPTALVLPIADIVAGLARRGVDTLVDGAHAPGMVPLALDGLGAAYYTGNGHKWLCAPKGVAFLHVRRDRQAGIRPLVISHGANARRTDRSRFRLEFDWTGTSDPSAVLALPVALAVLGSMVPGGWPELMEANRRLALAGRDLLCGALRVAPPAPDAMIGSMAAVPLPAHDPPALPRGTGSLQAALVEVYGIEVPVTTWPVDAVFEGEPPVRSRLVRISAQRYNEPAQYAALADALRDLLGA
jgi:isopenicillin-N epimerase